MSVYQDINPVKSTTKVLYRPRSAVNQAIKVRELSKLAINYA